MARDLGGLDLLFGELGHFQFLLLSGIGLTSYGIRTMVRDQAEKDRE